MLGRARPGESFKLLVTYLKIKKGVPTVIRVAGREYILRAEGQFNQTGRGRKRDRP
jgi:hypothetical protein